MTDKPELKPIKDIKLTKDMTDDQLMNAFRAAGGFTAKKLAVGTDIVETMVKDKECMRILTFPAAIMSTGVRGVVVELVKRKLFDLVITTCGTMDHDLARLWRNYYHGKFAMDDRKLHQQGINREGNILIPNDSYGIILEEKMQPLLQKLYDDGMRDFAPHEMVWEFGKALDSEPNKEESFTYWCYKNKIPVIIPAPTDGAWGYQIWLFWQNGHKDFNMNIMKDEEFLNVELVDAKKAGALMIGGGISKHHCIWWNQFRDGLDYGVYITTAPEWDGSLSGAQMREAISWGKLKEDAKFITIEGEATILLPLMISSVISRIK